MILIMIAGTNYNKFLSKEEKDFQWILNLSIIGIGMFLLIWETRSRYLVNYSFIFLTNTYIGLNAIIKYHRKKKTRRISNEKRDIIHTINS